MVIKVRLGGVVIWIGTGLLFRYLRLSRTGGTVFRRDECPFRHIAILLRRVVAGADRLGLARNWQESQQRAQLQQGGKGIPHAAQQHERGLHWCSKEESEDGWFKTGRPGCLPGVLWCTAGMAPHSCQPEQAGAVIRPSSPDCGRPGNVWSRA